MRIDLTPVGVVRSPYPTALDAPRQGALARLPSTIEIAAEFEAALSGIEAGDDLLVLWWADRADRTLLRRPDSDGVFRQRTPNRPNPLCVTDVHVLRREGRTLLVSGLDAVDGSPVLDLKSARAEWEGSMPLPGVAHGDEGP